MLILKNREILSPDLVSAAFPNDDDLAVELVGNTLDCRFVCD
jgi:hypothetical protein